MGTSSTIRLFADDALIYRKIASNGDVDTLQKDLNTLVQWSNSWQMRFNPAKCSLLRIARKRNTIKAFYDMMGTQLATTAYLGVELSSDLEWKHHIQQVTCKAQRTLKFLQRNLYRCPQKVKQQAYISLVRQTLEYAASVWDPHHQKDINKLEKVQRKAVRFITGNYRRRRRTSVTALRSDMGLPTLKQRRTATKLCMLYKINHQQVSIEVPSHYIPSSTPTMQTRKRHSEHYAVITTRQDRHIQA